MTDFPAAGHISNSARTETEVKTDFDNWLGATKQLPGALPQTTLILASDQITPTREAHLVDTQAAAATDNLAQILTTNLPDGSYFRMAIVSNSRVVVVKHAAGGTGQISLVNAVDFTMDNTTMSLLLQRNGTVWEERDRFYGTNTAANRAFHATAGLGQNTFTGRQEQKKGADIASAATLPLGTDGNYFHVTGTTTISAILSAPPGTEITLEFDGVLTITHNATSLILPGGSNLSTGAGTMLKFISEGSGNWRLMGEAAQGVQVLDRVTVNQTVSNTAAELGIYGFVVPGGTLGTNRRLRLTMQIDLTDNGGVDAVLTIKARFGVSMLVQTLIRTGLTPDSLGSTPLGYVCEVLISGDGATNAQVGHIVWSGPIRMSSGSTTILGAQEVSSVETARGFGTDDSTSANNLSVAAQWSSANATRGMSALHAVLVRE
jgi:hypothetical protein